MKKATIITINPAAMFRPDERFIRRTFVVTVKRRYSLTDVQSEKAFDVCLESGLLYENGGWGDGSPYYSANKGSVTI
jgi:hypothetical protein